MGRFFDGRLEVAMTNLRLEGFGAVAATVSGAVGALLDLPLAVGVAVCLALLVTVHRISTTKSKRSSGGVVTPIAPISEPAEKAHHKVGAF
jgi:hypothetical protein